MSETNGYNANFIERGARYLRALSNYPDARAEEFANAVASARPQPGHRVIDAPAGGGMLAEFLPVECPVARLECAPGFSNGPGVRSHAYSSIDCWPLACASAERVISVAGVHHLHDKRRFYQEAWRCLVPGGVFLLAEVGEDTPVAAFLDGFVDRHNPQGHQGFYLNDRVLEQLQQSGFVIDSVVESHYQWRFADQLALVEFCSDQFGLLSLPTTEFMRQVSAYLPLNFGSPQEVSLPWQLRHIRATKPAT